MFNLLTYPSEEQTHIFDRGFDVILHMKNFKLTGTLPKMKV